MKQNLQDLFYLREEVLMNMEYSNNMMLKLKTEWNKFKRYYETKDTKYYNEDLIHSYLHENYNCKLLNNEKLEIAQKSAIKAMSVLIDVRNIESYLPIVKNNDLNNYYSELLNDYLSFNKDVLNNSEKTLAEKRISTIQFLKYLEDNNINSIDNLSKEIVLKYLDENKNTKQSARIKINWCLRSLFQYLNDSKLKLNNYELLLPKIKRVKNRKLPATFEAEDANKIVNYLKENVGTTTSSYKNYAMVLIASKLGIRKIDICNLKWENINWNTNTINFIQVKTHKQATLPLPIDVGDAIIDYIKKERPIKIRGNDDYIFIRHIYPLTKLSNYYSLTSIIIKAMIATGISPDKYKQKGLHSFRFTLATELLNENVPTDIISSVLGHSNLNSTKTYMRVNKNNLEKCFIEVDYE